VDERGARLVEPTAMQRLAAVSVNDKCPPGSRARARARARAERHVGSCLDPGLGSLAGELAYTVDAIVREGLDDRGALEPTPLTPEPQPRRTPAWTLAACGGGNALLHWKTKTLRVPTRC
jgi:hypothetical protein